MQINNFSLEKKFITASVNYILKIIKSALLQKSSVNIALSGGSTPLPIYKALGEKIAAKKLLPAGRQVFQKIHFYQVDERYVPTTHKNSNQKMITAAFIVLLNSKSKNVHFHYFDTSLPIRKSLKEYSEKLPKNFDLTILGIGPDGHTASLFPNSKELTSKKTVIHTTMQGHSPSLPAGRQGAQLAKCVALPPLSDASLPTNHRLTLTFPIILKSKNILVLLKNKPEIIRELRTPTKSSADFPAHKLKLHKKLNIYSQA